MNAPDLALDKPHTGPLDWRVLLRWMRKDGLVGDEVTRATEKRFHGTDSRQHPLVRIAGLGLVREKDPGKGSVLDVESLTEWLAGRLKLPYLRIDPLKVDVGRVAEVMSISYAERRRALPLSVGLRDVTIGTCEPCDTGWVPEIEAHTGKPIKLVLVSPLGLQKYTAEFYSL